MTINPFRVSVWDKSFGFVGWIGNPTEVHAIPRHNGLPTGSLVIDGDHRWADALMDVDSGVRAHIDYEGTRAIGGRVMSAVLQGPSSSSQLTVQIEDDWRLLTRILGWQVPGSAISAQSASEYRVITGPAETVVKTLVAQNVARLGLPVTCATDLGRGDTITVSIRMLPLTDRLLPAIDQAGIGVTVRQTGSGFILDCYESSPYPVTLTEASGIVETWKLSRAAAKATRAVIGGSGDGTARGFRAVVDTALEAATGDVIEVFVDARETSDTTVLDARGFEHIAEGAPTAGLAVTFSETAHFRYGPGGVSVGDIVTLDVGKPITDVLRTAELVYTAADGVSATPVIGQRSDDPNTTLVQAVSAALRASRNANVRS